MADVFIIGSKGIPASYGGYETFVDKLTSGRVSPDIRYHVACAVDEIPGEWEFECNGAHCFNILRKRIGSANAIVYDIDALRWSIEYIEKHHIEHPIVYVLACRIGPFFKRYVTKIHRLGGTVLVNPDGHEWKRQKWNAPTRKYWKISERKMVKHADLVVCDSVTIESYIRSEYASFRPNTMYLSYGADLSKSALADDDERYLAWMREKDLTPGGYYLVVGRFVPENNYLTAIREFMESGSSRSFALITGATGAFLEELERKTGFKEDPRIKFVGTVYDQELLKKIRENAFAYIHGHEVGGTNPSLLEALSLTKLNLLLDVGFNREVAGEAALYWTKEPGSMRNCIAQAEALAADAVASYDAAATDVIRTRYSWASICAQYENLFLQGASAGAIRG